MKASATAQNRALLEAINGGRIPRFADGGIVSGLASPPSGAPMIGGQTNHFSPVINVSGAQAGSPSQNKDLAMQISKHVTEAAQMMVGKEIYKQMRPGGMLRR